MPSTQALRKPLATSAIAREKFLRSDDAVNGIVDRQFTEIDGYVIAQLFGLDQFISGKHRAIDGARSQRGKPGRFAAGLQYRHVFVRIEVVMPQCFAQRHVGERAITADADFFVLQIRGALDRGSGDHGFQELIDAAGDQNQVEAFRPRADRRRRRHIGDLNIAGDDRLDNRRAAGNVQQLRAYVVSFEKSRFIGDPQRSGGGRQRNVRNSQSLGLESTPSRKQKPEEKNKCQRTPKKEIHEWPFRNDQ